MCKPICGLQTLKHCLEPSWQTWPEDHQAMQSTLASGRSLNEPEARWSRNIPIFLQIEFHWVLYFDWRLKFGPWDVCGINVEIIWNEVTSRTHRHNEDSRSLHKTIWWNSCSQFVSSSEMFFFRMEICFSIYLLWNANFGLMYGQKWFGNTFNKQSFNACFRLYIFSFLFVLQ